MSLTREARKEIERFLRDGKKIGAVKYLKDTYGFSLNEAKVLVEAMENQMAGVTTDAYSHHAASEVTDDAVRTEVLDLLQKGRKIQAIKVAKTGLKTSLKHAKDWVEAMERGTSPLPAAGVAARTGGGMGIILGVFMGVGLLLVGGAAYVYFSQTESIQKSDLIKGKVVRLQQNDDGMSAPVIEYEWRGQKWLYASTTYSSPPAFIIDEEVPVYVNRDDPNDITVDTFSERWLLIMILGVLGGFFIGIPTLILYINRRV